LRYTLVLLTYIQGNASAVLNAKHYWCYRHLLCFYSKTNQMNNISNLFYFGTHSTCFGLSAHHQESRSVQTASGMCHTGSVAACCAVLFQNKINLRYCASGLFYYRNIKDARSYKRHIWTLVVFPPIAL